MGRKGVREVGVELGLWGAPWYLTGTVHQVLSPPGSLPACEKNTGISWMAGITPEKLPSKLTVVPALYSSSFLTRDGNKAGKDAKIKYCVQLSQQSPEQCGFLKLILSLVIAWCSVPSPCLRDSCQINTFLQLYLLFPGNHPPWKNKALGNEKEWKAISYPLYPPLARLSILNSTYSHTVCI